MKEKIKSKKTTSNSLKTSKYKYKEMAAPRAASSYL